MLILCVVVTLAGVAVVWALNGVTSIVSPVESEEDALEISKNSTTIQRWLPGAEWYRVEVEYLNVTEIAELKEEASESWYYEFLPDDHGVWRVTWVINPKEEPSAVYFSVIHWIDEEDREILYEDGIAFR